MVFCTPSKSSDVQQVSSSAFQVLRSDLPVIQMNGRYDEKIQQGVLYKRRDIFTAQWRARWFILDEQNGNLAYYVFSSNVPQPKIPGTPQRQTHNTPSDVAPRVKGEAMPRGRICLRDCRVKVEDELSRPEEDIFAFSIRSLKDESTILCCLASTMADARDEWIEAISRICEGNRENEWVEAISRVCEDVSDDGSLQEGNRILPLAISNYLETESTDFIHEGDISDELISSDSNRNRLGNSDNIKFARRKLLFEDRDLTTIAESETLLDSIKDETCEASFRHQSDLLIGIIILTPLVIYNIIDGNSKEIAFVISAFIAIRTATLLKLGTVIPEVSRTVGTRTFSCYFKVSLERFLHILPQLQLYDKSQEKINVSILSLVVKAVGRAACEIDEVNCKKAYIPTLGIKGCFLRLGSDTSVLHSFKGKSEQIITIANVADLSLDEVSEQINDLPSRPTMRGLLRRTLSFCSAMLGLTLNNNNSSGSCLVISCQDTEGDGMDLRIAPRGEFNAAVVVGGVRFVRQSSFSKSVSKLNDRLPPNPFLSVSVTMDCSVCTIAVCQRFIERVQELLEDPNNV
mmetsp:Transcript_4865/g.7039  ORF Transcript_4865/g.7039 Transcript_4865/m.7039 type:complete len:574 (+) Transcript_4865:3-1724(+)